MVTRCEAGAGEVHHSAIMMKGAMRMEEDRERRGTHFLPRGRGPKGSKIIDFGKSFDSVDEVYAGRGRSLGRGEGEALKV